LEEQLAIFLHACVTGLRTCHLCEARHFEAEMRRVDVETRKRAAEVKMRLDEARLADLQRPSTQTRVIELFSHLDSGFLGPQALMGIVDLFNSDIAIAATYLVMEQSDVMHRVWIERELSKLNIASGT
jgi:hypothetical protein